MATPGEYWRRLCFLFQQRRFHREMREELQFHLDKRAENNRLDGVADAEARRMAHLRLGNIAEVEIKSRDAWGWSSIDRLVQDIRFACRGLIRNRAFSAIIVFTFACGIGVNTAVFSAVHALLLNPYPFPQPDRLMSVEARHISGKNKGTGWADFRDWQSQNNLFESMAIFPWAGGFTLTGFGEPQHVTGGATTPDFLRVLDIEPALGRFFTRQEDTPGGPQVAVLSYAFWQERFALDPAVLGRSLTLEGKQYTIIGVLPRGFVLPGIPTCDFFTPLQDRSSGRYQHQYYVIARLRPGVSLVQAQSQMTSIAQRLEREYPATNIGWGITVRPLRELLAEHMRAPMMILSGAVGFVLLLACATVSGLLLARVSGRAKEVAVRTSLGASRLRILRQMVTESVVLSCAGGGAGVLVAVWIMKIVRTVAPGGLGLDVSLRLSPVALAFTVVASLLTGVLSGAWPAWHISGVDPNSVLKSDGNAWGRTRSRNRWMFGLVAGETILALLLMTCAGLLSKSLLKSLHLDTGIDVEHLLTFSIHLPEARYETGAKDVAFFRDLLDRLNHSAGVQKSAGVSTLPMTSGLSGGSFQVEGRPKAADWVDTMVQYTIVTPGYFGTMGIPLLRGRDFNEQDTELSLPVGILNDVVARQYFPNQDPIGHRYQDDYTGQWRTIVGVVAAIKNQQPMNPAVPGVFAPHAQSSQDQMWVVVRGRGEESQLIAVARTAVYGLDSQLVLRKIRTMRQVVADSLSGETLITGFLNGFAGFSLLLASIGICGLVDYSARERTREMGLRFALGATYSSVLWLALKNGLLPVFVGILVGIPAALVSTSILRSMLFGVSATDATVFACVPLALILVALVASLLPARRAANVNLIRALRSE